MATITPLNTASFAALFKEKTGRTPTQAELTNYINQRKTVSADDFISSITGTKKTQEPLPMQPGEYDYLKKKYTDAGYTEEQAIMAVESITAGRPKETTYSENPVIDAIVKSIPEEDFATTDLQWTEDLQANARKIAEAEFGPYYERIYEKAQSDLISSLAEYSRQEARNLEDTELAKKEAKSTYEDYLTQARRNYADVGLTYSSERLKKEKALQSDLEKSVSAAELANQRAAENIESQRQTTLGTAEEQLGTERLRPYIQGEYKSPYSESFTGKLEREKKSNIVQDIQSQKADYLTTY